MVEIDMTFSNHQGDFEKSFGYNSPAIVIVQFE